MKKKLLSILLMICMVFTMTAIPVSADAGANVEGVASVRVGNGEATGFPTLKAALADANTKNGSTLTLLADFGGESGNAIPTDFEPQSISWTQKSEKVND